MADYTLKRLYENALQSIPKLGWSFPVSKEGNADERVLLEKLTNGTYEDKVNIGGWAMSANSSKTLTLATPSTIERIDKIVIFDDDGIEHDMSWLYCDQFLTGVREIAQTSNNSTGNSAAGIGYLPQLVACGIMSASNYPSAPSFTRYSGAEHTITHAGAANQYYINFTPAQLAAWGGNIAPNTCFCQVHMIETDTYHSEAIYENQIHIKIANTQEPFRYYIFRQQTEALSTSTHNHWINTLTAGMSYRSPLVGYRYNRSTGVITMYHNARAGSQDVLSSAPGTGVLSRFTGSNNRGIIYFRRNFAS